MSEYALEPAIFFRTMRARELLLVRGRPVSVAALARFLRRDVAEMRADFYELFLAGLVTSPNDPPENVYELTEEGKASLRWSCPPPPDGVLTARWVGQLARAIADHHGLEMADMLRAEVGAAVVARSRLCFGLWARGWSVERIEEHFGLHAGWAKRAIERWKRLRDELPPRSGIELREWRRRHKLTQAQAAVKLGVNRRTVMRAERSERWSQRMVVQRA